MAYTDQEISSFVNSNINDPAKVAEAMRSSGIGMDRVLAATGYTADQAKQAFGAAGIDYNSLYNVGAANTGGLLDGGGYNPNASSPNQVQSTPNYTLNTGGASGNNADYTYNNNSNPFSGYAQQQTTAAPASTPPPTNTLASGANNQSIASFVNSNINDPYAVAKAMQDAGIPLSQVLSATGYSDADAKAAFGRVGINVDDLYKIGQPVAPSANPVNGVTLDLLTNLYNSATKPQQTNTVAAPLPMSTFVAPAQAQSYSQPTQAIKDAATAAQQSFNFNKYTTPAPAYQGLMSGDYDKLQESLTTPGQLDATNAYNTGLKNLSNTMSGRGLYGSSIMQNQQTQGLDREYMNAVASNAAKAASSRYAIQQSDLQKAADLSFEGWKAGSTENTAANQIAGTLANTATSQVLSNSGQLDNTALQGANALNVQSLSNAGQLANTTLAGQNTLANTSLSNAGQLANTTLAGQNALANTSLSNAGQLANTTLAGQNTLANTSLSNAGQLANTTLNNQGNIDVTNLQGANQLANTGLLGNNQLANTGLNNKGSMDVTALQGANQLANTGLLGGNQLTNTGMENQNRLDIAGINAGSSKYQADANTASSTANNNARIAVANIEAQNQANQLAQQYKLATSAADQSAIAGSLKALGWVLGPDGKFARDAANSVLQWSGGLLDSAGNTISEIWDYINN